MLGIAGVLESALQIILPVILVRALSPEAFGDYRIVWLLASTALAIFPLALPQSLFHFLPKAEPALRPRLVGNVWLFVTLSGLTAAALLVLSWSWWPASISGLQRYSLLAPAFLALWVMGSLMDVLPTADGNLRWQACAMAALAVFRTSALGLAAVVSRDAWFVLLAMTIFALTKVLLVPLYSLTAASSRGLALQYPLLVRQVRYALPFAVGNALFMLRIQAVQWIVATHFPPDVFALISIAAVVIALINSSALVRTGAERPSPSDTDCGWMPMKVTVTALDEEIRRLITGRGIICVLNVMWGMRSSGMTRMSPGAPPKSAASMMMTRGG